MCKVEINVYMCYLRMGSPVGLSLADLPNIFIMVASIIALFIMLVILLRNMEVIGIMGDGADSSWGPAMPPARLVMQRVHIPFTFKLLEGTSISYIELNCTITSTVRYWRGCWWGAPVRDLHRVLWGPFSELHNSLNIIRDNAHDEKRIKLTHNEPLQLGPPPRTCYPLVVVLAREDQPAEELRPDDTVALITVIHIQDDQCSLRSMILAQYLKQANGHLTCLKQLYVTGDAPETQMAEGYSTEGDLCCVCATLPLSRALLPCRHACLCHKCLPKLDRCPICRSMISSYFCIGNDEDGLNDLKPQYLSFNRRLFNLFHHHRL